VLFTQLRSDFFLYIVINVVYFASMHMKLGMCDMLPNLRHGSWMKIATFDWKMRTWISEVCWIHWSLNHLLQHLPRSDYVSSGNQLVNRSDWRKMGSQFQCHIGLWKENVLFLLICQSTRLDLNKNAATYHALITSLTFMPYEGAVECEHNIRQHTHIPLDLSGVFLFV
jgi:hypothetical protein